MVVLAQEKYKEAEPLLKRIVQMVEAPSDGLVSVLNDYVAALEHLN